MTYGIELKNAYGERVAGDGPITYLKAAGDCRIASDFAGYPGQFQLFYPYASGFGYQSGRFSHVVDGQSYPAWRTGSKPLYEKEQWVASSIDALSNFQGRGLPMPLTQNLSDLIFVEINQHGIIQAASIVLDFVTMPKGKVMMVTPSPAQTARLKYKVSSPDFPAPVP